MPLFKQEEKFDRHKLQTALKMAVTRLNMQKNKRENLVKVQRREIAELLRAKKEDSARIKVESCLRDVYTAEACELITLFIDLLSARIQLICESRMCPPDMKEAVSTIIWATPRIENIPELLTIREQLARKFGKEFVIAAADNSEMAVHQKVFYRLSMQVPEPYLCVQYMKDIATGYEVDWVPSATAMDATAGVGSGVKLPDPVSSMPPPPQPPHHVPGHPVGPPPQYYPPPQHGAYGPPPVQSYPPPLLPGSDPTAPPLHHHMAPPPPMRPGMDHNGHHDSPHHPVKEAAPLPPPFPPAAPAASSAPPSSADVDFSDLEARFAALKRGQ